MIPRLIEALAPAQLLRAAILQEVVDGGCAPDCAVPVAKAWLEFIGDFENADRAALSMPADIAPTPSAAESLPFGWPLAFCAGSAIDRALETSTFRTSGEGEKINTGPATPPDGYTPTTLGEAGGCLNLWTDGQGNYWRPSAFRSEDSPEAAAPPQHDAKATPSIAPELETSSDREPPTEVGAEAGPQDDRRDPAREPTQGDPEAPQTDSADRSVRGVRGEVTGPGIVAPAGPGPTAAGGSPPAYPRRRDPAVKTQPELILDYLSEEAGHSGATFPRIADAVGIKAPSAQAVLSGMVKKGDVEADDGRGTSRHYWAKGMRPAPASVYLATPPAVSRDLSGPILAFLRERGGVGANDVLIAKRLNATAAVIRGALGVLAADGRIASTRFGMEMRWLHAEHVARPAPIAAAPVQAASRSLVEVRHAITTCGAAGCGRSFRPEFVGQASCNICRERSRLGLSAEPVSA